MPNFRITTDEALFMLDDERCSALAHWRKAAAVASEETQTAASLHRAKPTSETLAKFDAWCETLEAARHNVRILARHAGAH